jgi:hypothetical protein
MISADPAEFCASLTGRERGFDYLFFLLYERAVQRACPFRPCAQLRLEPTFIHCEGFSFAEDNRTFDDILEFPDIAGPYVCLKRFQGLLQDLNANGTTTRKACRCRNGWRLRKGLYDAHCPASCGYILTFRSSGSYAESSKNSVRLHGSSPAHVSLSLLNCCVT